MTLPVLVIHGIANRTLVDLQERVDFLIDGTGYAEVHPVFWGDLGAATDFIDEILPGVASRRGRSIRGGEESWQESAGRDDLAVALVSAHDGTVPPPPQRLDHLLAGLRAGVAEGTASGVADPGGQIEQQLSDALAEAWASPEQEWLWAIGDPDLLVEIGAAVGRTVLELADPDRPFEVRSPQEIKNTMGAVLRGMDRMAAATMSTAAARFTAWIRDRVGKGMAQTIGDLLIYHRHREEIHQRVRESIAKIAGCDAGRDPGHRVHLVGHSLGAVIAMDLATSATNPVHAESVVTFGSHWPLLHLWHPYGAVPPYRGEPVTLPLSIRRWINLWESLDPMAFLAAPLFRLPDGSAPRDVELARSGARTLFTHSAYWQSSQLLTVLAEAWREAAAD